ncbi:hypothetical protein ACX1NB_02785 [Mycoplasma sp. HF14]
MIDKYIKNLLMDKNIIVHGSYALKILGLLERDNNDIDLLIFTNKNIIENNLFLDEIIKVMPKIKINRRDEFYAKCNYGIAKIEFMLFKFIHNSMILNSNGIKILKPEWIFVFKICQLFTARVIDISKKPNNVKIINTINDLNSLLNKLEINSSHIVYMFIKAIKINLYFELILYYKSPYSEIFNFEEFFCEYISFMSIKLKTLLSSLEHDKEFIKFMNKLKSLYTEFHLYAEYYYKIENQNYYNFGLYFFYGYDSDDCVNDLILLRNGLNIDDVSKPLKVINKQICIDFYEIINQYFD